MTTTSNCRLQVAILSLALYVLTLPGYSKADFKINSTLLNHPRSINRILFVKVRQVLSVTSPYPRIIMRDRRWRNAISYNGGGLPHRCPIPVTITALDRRGNGVKFTGTVTVVNYFNTSILPNAVGISGDKRNLDALIARLSGSHELKIISRNYNSPKIDHVPGHVAIVLLHNKYKNVTNPIPKLELEDMVENTIMKTPEFNNLTRITGNCGPSCPEICDTELKPIEDSNGILSITLVTSQNDIVESYFPSYWKHTCIRHLQGDCTESSKTCFNGGTCSAKRDTSPDICTCNPQTNLYGPRCQLLTRSYEGTSTRVISSHHRLSHSGMIATPQAQRLTFSFEHAGVCQLYSGLCTIVSVKASGRDLVRVQEGVVANRIFDTATLPSEENLVEKNMTLHSDRMVQNNRWIEVTVHVELQGKTLKATTVFCTKEASPVCVEKKMEKIGALYKLKDVELTLGGHVSGCFRNVRFNGGLVDLKLATSVPGTREGCGPQSNSCSNTCGDGDANSVCYGVLRSSTTLPCSCKCSSSKRMPAERITLATQCAMECTTESPIISIAGTGTLEWRVSNGTLIPLDPQAPLTISFLMRTKQTVASELMKVVGNSITLSIKLADTHLSACINGKCHAFSSVQVNNGKWHEIFVMVAKTQLTVRVSDYTRVYIITSNQPISGATVSMQLVNSCIRDVRLSGIYMPTSRTDKTVEKDSSNSIKLQQNGTVSAGSTCGVVK